MQRNEMDGEGEMKKITCKELGGACEQAFLGDSFADVARQSRQHAMEMFAKTIQII